MVNAENALFSLKPCTELNKKKIYEQYPKSIFGALCSLWKLETPTLEHHVGEEVCRALRDGNRCLEIVRFYEL